MSTLPRTYITPEQYLDIERRAEFRSEYYDGAMFAMAEATGDHMLIIRNLVTALDPQVRPRGCHVYFVEMRVRVSPSGLYTYPDVVVACRERQFLDERRDTLLNPTVIIEILSESTERYDRGRKFDLYAPLECLRAYVLVASDRFAIDAFVRQPDGQWLLSKANRPEDVVALECIGCRLRLADVYDEVEFAA